MKAVVVVILVEVAPGLQNVFALGVVVWLVVFVPIGSEIRVSDGRNNSREP